MKLYYILFALFFLVFTACEEDYLEKLPEDSLSPEAFYNNPANFSTALYGIYDAMQSRYLFGNLPETDAITDNSLFTQFTAVVDFINFSKGVPSANSNGLFANYYLYPYQVIQRANALLDKINLPGSLTAVEKATIEAEARALRALAYMRLAYLYGDVPLVTTALERSEALNVKRTPKSEVIAFILSEFQAAATALGTKPYNNEAGRLTKQAVLGLRAKVLIYEARMGKGNWNDARTAISEAMTVAQSAGAKLFTSGDGSNAQENYDALFWEKNEDNAEVLFALNFNATDLGYSISQYYAVAGGNLSMSIHNNFVKDFYTTDGLPITDPKSIYNATQPYDNRDPRLKAIVAVPGEMYSTGTAMAAFKGKATKGVLETDFALRKLTTLGGAIPLNKGEVDAIILRYADILLLFAEAENEVNGPTTAAYNAINQIRTRVKMPAVTPGLSKEAFRAEVLHERRIELAFEGQRWFDLITLGIADKTINGIGELGRAFVPNKQELFPIPQSELALNPNMTQNPGY